MDYLNLPPDQSAYSADLGNDILTQKVMGGPSRSTRIRVGATSLVNATWIIDVGQHQYLMAFYRRQQRNPSQPFNVELVLDDVFGMYTAKFVYDSVKLVGALGSARTVTCQLEVYYKPPNDLMDDAIVNLWSNGDPADQMVNQLEKLANVDLPSGLHT